MAERCDNKDRTRQGKTRRTRNSKSECIEMIMIERVGYHERKK